MTAYQLFQLPKNTQIDSSVRVTPGALAHFYATTTTTPQDTYTDAALTTPSANPVVADANGVFQAIYLDPTLIYKLTLTTSAGVLIYSVDPVNDQVLSALAIGRFLYPLSSAEQTAGLSDADIEDFSRPHGNIIRYGAAGDGGTTNNSPAIQAACDQCVAGGADVVIPGTTSFYRCNTAIALASGARVRGDGTWPGLRFYGVNGFVLAAGLSSMTIEGLQLFGCDAAGTLDPKTFNGIVCAGTNSVPTRCNYIVLERLYMQGWNRCIDWSYTWISRIDNVTTINCNVGVRIFGQSVLATITRCQLGANTGTASIQIVGDAGIRAEGISISDSSLNSGTYGIQIDQFGILSLRVVNCDLDQIGDVGIEITNAQSTSIVGTWISAVNKGIHWNPLAIPTTQKISVTECHITTSAAGSRCLHIEYDNDGINIVGGSLTCAATGASRCLEIDIINQNIAIVGTHLVNPSANASILDGTGGLQYSNLTGNATIDKSAFPTVVAAAAIALPNSDVVKISGNTNITSISTTKKAGQRVTLIFLGTPTFTDGSNLKLAGNFVATADDTITLVCDEAGNYFECSRSIN